MTVFWYALLIAAVGIERLVELVVSKRNWVWSGNVAALSCVGHYPVMVVLHVGLLAGCLIEVIALHRPFVPSLGWPMVVVILAAQVLRWWCITTLGHQWNTRVIVVPGAPRVTGGPYRLIPHPNYVAVVVEGIALPLVHSAWITALVFTRPERRAAAHAAQGRERRAREPDVIDLLVAGAGPAGLATALYGAQAGLDVAVVERRSGVLDKACGEGMMPHTVAHLDRLGVTAEGRPLQGISYIDGGRRVNAAFRNGAGRGVRRTVLHAALWRAAEAAGVKLVHGEFGEITQDEKSVCAAGFQARYLAAADGLHSPIRKSLGLSAPAVGPRRWGIRRHYAIAPWTASVEVHWSKGAEAYVTPVAEDCVGVAILSSTRGGFDSHFESFAELRDRVAGHAHGQDRAAGPLRQKVSNRTAGRVLLVGDAAGYIHGPTGEGMGLAFGAAELVVNCVVGDRPEGLRPTVAQADASVPDADGCFGAGASAPATSSERRSGRTGTARRLRQARQPARSLNTLIT